MLDYDGTLAPFVELRDQAVPYPGVREALTAIQASGRTRLVIVSGRAIDDLKPLLNLDPLPEIWGNHGWERLLPNGVYQGPGIEDHVRECFAEARSKVLTAGQGVVPMDFEQKPASLALHWRRRDPQVVDVLQAAVRKLWEPLVESANLTLKAFDGGLELGLPDKDKGSAVRTILAEAADDTVAAYLGDDQTDEDAFRALGDRGYGVLVRPNFRPTAATFWLKPPEGLLEFLGYWAEVDRSGSGKEETLATMEVAGPVLDFLSSAGFGLVSVNDPSDLSGLLAMPQTSYWSGKFFAGLYVRVLSRVALCSSDVQAIHEKAKKHTQHALVVIDRQPEINAWMRIAELRADKTQRFFLLPIDDSLVRESWALR